MNILLILINTINFKSKNDFKHKKFMRKNILITQKLHLNLNKIEIKSFFISKPQICINIFNVYL